MYMYYYMSLWENTKEFRSIWKRTDRRKFGTHGPSKDTCIKDTFHATLFEFILWSLSALCNFPMLRLSKRLLLQHFCQSVSTKFYGKHGNRGEIQAVFLAIYQIKKKTEL